MLNEDQKIRVRVLFVLAAMVCAAIGVFSGWPLWVWIPLSALLLIAPTLISYALAEWVLLRGGRQHRVRTPRAQHSDGDVPAAPTSHESASTHRPDGTGTFYEPAAQHAAALVRTLPEGERQTMFARGLAKVLDAHELHDAADSMRNWFDNAATSTTRTASTATSRSTRAASPNGF